MNIFKRITVMFLVMLSLFSSASLFAEDFYLFKDAPNLSAYKKAMENNKLVDYFESAVYGLDVSWNGKTLKEIIFEEPDYKSLLGMCSPKSEKLRAKHGVKPATVKDCADVIQAAYDTNLAGRMTNTQAETVIKSAVIVYNNNMLKGKWDNKLLSKTLSGFDKRHNATKLTISGLINAGHVLSVGLQDSILEFADGAYYVWLEQLAVIAAVSPKVCKRLYDKNSTSRNCPGLDKHNNIKPNE